MRERDRQRQSVSGGGSEREGDRIWSRFQALRCLHRAQHGAWTHKPWDHDLSQSRMLHWLSHPGAPRKINIFRWLAWNVPLVFIGCNTSFKWKYKSLRLSGSILKITQAKFQSSYLYVYCGFIATVETLHKSNSAFHSTHSTNSIFSLLKSKERLNRKETITLSFPFFLGHHFQYYWPTQESNTSKEWVPW